jgi:tungstate transport system ATP-binding protein
MVKQAIFRLANLTKTYNDRTVLQIEQLEIVAGEILALVGPSGAGKSTLLRQLNFLEQPSGGHLSFAEQRWNGNGPPLDVRRAVTTVFQNPVLLNRSVGANVAYGLKIRGQAVQTVHQAVTAALSRVGLQELSHVPARTLSGGERQRVALARALVVEPRVLLMDEPTANLDPYNVRLIEEIFCSANQEQGTTVVLVTHNIFQARRLAHRTALLLDGRLVEIADTHTFLPARLTPAPPPLSAVKWFIDDLVPNGPARQVKLPIDQAAIIFYNFP